MMALHDLVIRGGIVHDGSGGEPFQADLAIDDGIISVVGEVPGTGKEEIAADGMIVTPGFVDIHTHYDGQVTWSEWLVPSSQHGSTTVLMGNCGVGFAPCRPENRAELLNVMEGVEDIPQVVMAEGVPWKWETFPEYLDFLGSRVADVDFATQVPHAPVRIHVMGRRGVERELATDAELAEMTRLVAEAVRAGAFGVSTSRSMGHRSADGELAPTVTAEEKELIALARGLRDGGGGVFQLLPSAHEGKDPVKEMDLLRQLVAESGGRPLSFTLLNTNQFPENLDKTLALLSDVAAEGLPIKAQVFPRGVGVLFGLDASFHPFRYHPSYRAIEHLPLADRVAALREPAMRAQLLSEKPEHSHSIYLYFMAQTPELFLLGDPPNYEPAPSMKLSALAAAKGVSVHELAYDMMLEQEGRALFLLPASNFVDGTLEPVRRMMEHENALISLGDGGAHYGMICDSSYTSFLLSYWTRDRTCGPRIPLAKAVRALTRANAEAIGLLDRGLIAKGLKADINIIDMDRLKLRPPHMVSDLPAGGRRLVQEADGYIATIKNGIVTYRDGVHTGALPGRLLRNPATTVQTKMLEETKA